MYKTWSKREIENADIFTRDELKNFSWCHSEKDKNGQLKSLSWGANFFAQNIESGLNISTTVIGAYSVNVIIYYPNRFRCIPAVVMEDAKDTKKILDFKKLFKFLYLALRASALQGSNLPRCTSLPQLEPIQCYFHTKRKGFDYCSVGKITFLCWTFKTSSRHSVSFHVLQSIHNFSLNDCALDRGYLFFCVNIWTIFDLFAAFLSFWNLPKMKYFEIKSLICC